MCILCGWCIFLFILAHESVQSTSQPLYYEPTVPSIRLTIRNSAQVRRFPEPSPLELRVYTTTWKTSQPKIHFFFLIFVISHSCHDILAAFSI